MRQDVKGLEDETNAVAAKIAPPVLVQRGERGAGNLDAAAIRRVEPGHQVEQGRLADSRLTPNGDLLATCDRKLQPLEQQPPARNALGKLADVKGRSGHA